MRTLMSTSRSWWRRGPGVGRPFVVLRDLDLGTGRDADGGSPSPADVAGGHPELQAGGPARAGLDELRQPPQYSLHRLQVEAVARDRARAPVLRGQRDESGRG